MKILYALPFFYPYEVGGAEISTRLFAEGLAKRGHEIIILTLNFKKLKNEVEEFKKNIKIYRVMFPFPHKGISPFLDSCLFQFYLFVSTLLTIRRFNPDVVHIQSSQFIPGVFFASKLHNKKIFLTVRDHGYAFSFGYLKNIYNRLQNKLLVFLLPYIFLTSFFMCNLRSACIKKMDRIFPVSYSMKEFIKKRLKIPDEKFKVIYMPLPECVLKWKSKYKPSNKIRFLYIGRLEKTKGIDLLLKVFAILERKYPNVELHVVGNSNLQYYKKMTTNLGIKNVIFYGKVPNEKIGYYYDNADAVVIPSIREEPLSRVLIESVYLKKFVIAFDKGGNKEMIKENGIIVKKANKWCLLKGLENFVKRFKSINILF